MFFGSKMNENPQDILDEVYKILYTMGVICNEKVDLASYQLKDVAQTWYNQWRDNRVITACPKSWDVFMRAFLDKFFRMEKREAKVEESINLCPGGMSV